MSKDIEIGSALVTAVQGIGLEVTPADPPTPAVALPNDSVHTSKTPSLPPKTNPPRVVVVVGDTPSKVEKLDATRKLSYWPCAVVIITAGGRKFEDDERSRTWRAQIEEKVFDQQVATFAAVEGFNEVKSSGKSPFDPTALDKDLVYLTSNFEVSVEEDLA